MKQLRKRIKYLILSVVAICMLYPLFIFGKAQQWEETSSAEGMLNNPTQLTIFYRDHCGRCNKTLPKLFWNMGWKIKKLFSSMLTS